MLEEQLFIALAAAGAVVVTLLVLAVVLKRCLYVAGPNEILVVSGRPRVLPDGRTVGYRIVVGGRVVRMPFLERVDRMDATAMTVPVQLQRAYCHDGVPLDLSATATVRPSGDESELGNFIERFLGRRREEIVQVARETLEGHARAVVAQLSAAELNADREKIACEIRATADSDFSKLGLKVETLVLLEVTAPPPARVPD
jgi:flotillin